MNPYKLSADKLLYTMTLYNSLAYSRVVITLLLPSEKNVVSQGNFNVIDRPVSARVCIYATVENGHACGSM